MSTCPWHASVLKIVHDVVKSIFRYESTISELPVKEPRLLDLFPYPETVD